MTQLTTAGARVIDPILSSVAQGYKNAAMVADALFPIVPVGQRGGKIITFGKEHFRLYNTARAPGTNTKRVQYGYTGGSFALAQHSLEGVVPFELQDEAAAVPGINLGRMAVNRTQDIIFLDREYAAAQLARNASNYASSNKVTLSGTSQWSDPASNPSKDIETAREAIRAQIGRRPNTVELGAKVFSALKTHPAIIDRVKYTGRDSVTADLLANLWEVDKVVVGEAVYDNNGTMTDIWGKDVVVAYTELSGLADMGTPSYGYTYRLGGYPIVEQPYQDRSAKSWIYPVTDELAPVIAGAAGGYLISAAVA